MGGEVVGPPAGTAGAPTHRSAGRLSATGAATAGPGPGAKRIGGARPHRDLIDGDRRRGAHLRRLRTMSRVPRALRGPLVVVAFLVLAIVVAIPVLAASPAPSGSSTPAASGEGNGQAKGPKASHEPEVTVTVSGTVKATTDADGSTTYTLSSNGKTLKLEDGPKWWWQDKDPLKAWVGKSVTIAGEQSGDEIDVQAVNGVAMRAPGKPPWAGGWKAVGSIHPGWTQEKADRQKAKAAAKQQREAAKAACRAAGTCTDDEPEQSESPGS